MKNTSLKLILSRFSAGISIMLALTVQAASGANIETRYERAQLMMQGFQKRSGSDAELIRNSILRPHWIGDRDQFWYARETKLGHEYRLVNAVKGTNKPLFNQKRLAKKLEQRSGKTISAHKLPLSALTWNIQSEVLGFTAFGKTWSFNDKSGQLKQTTSKQVLFEGRAGVPSPNGKKIAFIRDHNVRVHEVGSGKEYALTHDGEELNTYGGSAQAAWGFAFPSWYKVQVHWSPDGKRLFALKRDVGHVGITPKVDYIPDDGDMRPEVIEERYPIASDAKGGLYKIMVIDLEDQKIIPATYPLLADDGGYGSAFFTGWPASRGWWGQNSKYAYFIDYTRDNKSRSLVKFNTSTGATKILFTETTDVVFKPHTVGLMKAIEETNELLLFSDRDGWAHLYLYDFTTGKVKKQLTKGDWVVRDILRIDAKTRTLLLSVSGRVKGRDPYYREIVQVNMDTGKLISLVSSNHDYDGISPSPSGHYFVTTRSRIDDTPVGLVFNQKGRKVMTVETADVSSLPKGWQWPEPVKMIAADGKTDIYGAIFRPSNLDVSKKYPVLEYTFYAKQEMPNTPKGAFVSSVLDDVLFREMASFAELGMIVVTIDGRGSVHRSKKFEADSYGWAPSMSNIDDRVAGMQQLAKHYPYMDLNRVGITGFRGATQALYALLERPDIYKAAILPEMHDARLIQYATVGLMEGLNKDSSTNTRHYKHNLHKLKGKLLIRHGMIDRFNTVGGAFRLIDALEKANKDFEMLVMPKQDALPSPYVTRRGWDFLVKNLIGEKPPAEFKLSFPFGL